MGGNKQLAEKTWADFKKSCVTSYALPEPPGFNILTFPNFHLNEINEGVGVAFLQKKDIPHVHIYVHVRIDCFLVGGGGYFTQDTPKYGPS